MADDEYSGSLKQQCPTSSGLYDWVRRFFRLSLQNGVLEALSGEQQQQHQDGGAVERGGDVSLSLENAKYAKEWSLSDMIAGFGFDIVWKDANITSFLASDAASCSKWVEHINAAINIHAQNVSDDYESVFAGGGGVNGGVGGGGGVGGDVGFEGNVPPLAARPPLHPPKLTASAENWHAGLGASVGTGGVLATMAEGADSTRLDPSSPVHHHQRNGNNNNNNNNMSADTIKRYSPGGGAGAGGGGARGSGIDEWSQSLSHSQVFALQQQQQQRERIGSFASNSDDGIGGGGGRGGGGTGIGEEGGGRIAVGGGGGGELGESLLGAELEREGNMAQVMLLQQRCQRLAQKAEREAADALLCREMMMKVQAELDARKGQYQREMESIQREREQAMQLQQSELEIRLLRVSNENTAFHDAALRAEREQSQREMACLREELAAERKRYSSLLQNESSLRDKAEGKEVSLVTEIARLKEQTQRAINEATRVKEVHAADVSAFEREKKIMITDLEARTARLEREREELSTKSQVEMRKKTNELAAQFEAKVKEMEKSISDNTKHELEGLHMRELAALQKRCASDIEAARSEERKHRVREVEALRSTFRDREKQTADDLTQLEKLHNERVARLEKHTASLKARCEQAEKEAKKSKEVASKGSVEVRKQITSSKETAEAQQKRAEGLLQQLLELQKNLQESRSREAAYREQLAKSLEEGRVQRAELHEAKRQASEAAAQCHQWRRVAQESDMTHSTAATSLQIAREEISMLEHETRRLREDNNALLSSLQKAEKLVYGNTHGSTSFALDAPGVVPWGYHMPPPPPTTAATRARAAINSSSSGGVRGVGGVGGGSKKTPAGGTRTRAKNVR